MFPFPDYQMCDVCYCYMCTRKCIDNEEQWSQQDTQRVFYCVFVILSTPYIRGRINEKRRVQNYGVSVMFEDNIHTSAHTSTHFFISSCWFDETFIEFVSLSPRSIKYAVTATDETKEKELSLLRSEH